MDSYMETQFLHHPQHDHYSQHQHQQPNSGLLRFRSAPSSLCNEFAQTLTDPENLNSRFDDEFSEPSYEKKPQRLSNSQNGYSGSDQLPPQYPKQHMGSTASTSIQRSNSLESMKHGNCGGGGGGGLNLNRQSSSPTGFFNHLDPQNGYTIMRGLESFRVGNGTNGESTPRLSRLNSSHLPQIPEIANEDVKETSADDVVKFIRNHDDDPGFESPTRFPFSSWNDSGSDASHLSENVGLASRHNLLTHHLSLPKTSAEMAVVEKLMHFQDAVPWKVRAKRGCATHPRSIAERMRRNRISERMRKLQELVPNMDKQTNTADMLDLAVEYIKNLQSQHKVLSDKRAQCKCVNLQNSLANQAT